MKLRRGGQRTPTVTLALLASAAVLALAAAAVEPYLAAAGNAATVSELERAGTVDAGLTIRANGRFDPDIVDEVRASIDARLPDERTSSSRVAVRADPVSLVHDGGADRIRLVATPRALDQLEVVDGRPDGGLLVPQVLADETGLAPGDAIEVVRGDHQTTATIAGVYRDLDPASAPTELQEIAEQAAPTPGREQRPLDPVFADVTTVLALTVSVGAETEVTWQRPTSDLTSLSEAQTLRARMLRVARDAEDPAEPIGAMLAAPAGGSIDTHVGLSAVVRDARQAVAALSGPTRGVGVAGQAVALAVVAAAALFAARARAIELRLATVRGQGPIRQGARAAARALPAMLAGSIVGWAVSLLLVRTAGPPGPLPPGTASASLRDVAFALAPALLVVAGVTAGAVATAVRVGRRRRYARLSRAPWELVPIALAAVALFQIQAGGGLRLESGSPRLSPLVLAFPVLVLLGAVGTGARAARRGLPALRRIPGRGGHAGYLALRRLAAASTPALAMAAACALTLGLVVYTATLSTSMAVAVEEKSILQVGADATATGSELDAAAADGTEVLRARGRLAPTDELVDVLLVDIDRFAEIAYWDPALGGGRDLATLLGALAADPERLPVLAAGLTDQPAVVDVPGFRVPVTIVDHLDALPSLTAQRPLLIASREAAEALAPADADGTAPTGRWSTEVWASGPDAADRLEAAGAATIRSGSEAAERPRLVAVTWALDALQALGVLATGLALVGVLLFVAARQRETQISYALARRMGLRPSTHRVALSGEVLLLLAVALVAATFLGILAASLVAGGLDPLPELRPAPRTTWPVAALGVLAGTLFVGGVAGAALLQRGADRANVAEVLRRG